MMIGMEYALVFPLPTQFKTRWTHNANSAAYISIMYGCGSNESTMQTQCSLIQDLGVGVEGVWQELVSELIVSESQTNKNKSHYKFIHPSVPRITSRASYSVVKGRLNKMCPVEQFNC